MNALGLHGVIFRPMSFKPFYGRDNGKQLKGVQVHLLDPAGVNLMAIQFLFMQVHHGLYPDKNPFELADASRIRMFDKVAGSDQVRTLFAKRMRYDDVRGFLEKDLQRFRATAGKYLLY